MRAQVLRENRLEVNAWLAVDAINVSTRFQALTMIVRDEPSK